MYDRTNAGEGGQPEVHSQSTREAERSGILQHACKLPSIIWEARMPAIHKNTQTLGALWVHLGCSLGALWVQLQGTLGALWVHFGCTLGSLWVIFRPKNVKHF